MNAIKVFLICCLFGYFSCYSIPPTSNKNIEKNENILGILGQLTNRTIMSNVLSLLNLLNNVQANISSLPNHLSSILNTSVFNLASILTGSDPQSKLYFGILFL
jgi:hypothetical protein